MVSMSVLTGVSAQRPARCLPVPKQVPNNRQLRKPNRGSLPWGSTVALRGTTTTGDSTSFATTI